MSCDSEPPIHTPAAAFRPNHRQHKLKPPKSKIEFTPATTASTTTTTSITATTTTSIIITTTTTENSTDNGAQETNREAGGGGIVGVKVHDAAGLFDPRVAGGEG